MFKERFPKNMDEYSAACKAKQIVTGKMFITKASELIDGFESPFGLELLSTVDWLIAKEKCEPTLESIKKGLLGWPAGIKWGERKLARIFHKYA